MAGYIKIAPRKQTFKLIKRVEKKWTSDLYEK